MADTKSPAERVAADGSDRNTDAARLMTDGETGGSRAASTSTSRTSSDLRRKNVANEAAVTINEGHVYREKGGGGQEVIPFFVDFARASVRFSPVGRSTEDEMRMGEFLNRFEEVDKSRLAEATPAESQKEAEARLDRKETTDQLGTVVMKDGKPVK